MNWPEVFKGIQLCIGFQLFLIAIFLLASKQVRNRILGYYTILICISSLASALYSYLERAPIIAFFFGAQLIIFHAPLLFFYVKSLKDNTVLSRAHFIFPVLYILSFLILKIYFTDFFDTYNMEILMFHLFLTVLYTSVYFYKGSKYFNVELNDSLKQKALKKFRWFYVITNIHAICLYSLMALSYFSYLYLYNEFPFVNERIVPNLFTIIVYVHPLTSIIFITYLLSETHSLQSLILRKGITKSYSVRDNGREISKGIKQIIDVEKKYRNPDFSLKQLSTQLGVGTKELAEYFNEELSISFNDYIHQKKIEEFKSLIKEDQEKTYSLEGMAQLAGFRSKATFYRVFKKMEGVTPAKYQEYLLRKIPS
ncbi:helix-turn-helix domain-containing protein [Flagellimonas sp.]|uniref:helix-turn-helix domain-containing protein n=1 Tax=Flagellimonas sp. TaxID=2058762 RepID=UPI003F4A1FCD